jgi:hypothetical protein
LLDALPSESVSAITANLTYSSTTGLHTENIPRIEMSPK